LDDEYGWNNRPRGRLPRDYNEEKNKIKQIKKQLSIGLYVLHAIQYTVQENK
jgi:hypothetical protein